MTASIQVRAGSARGVGQHEWEEGAGRRVDEEQLEDPAWASQDEGAMDRPLLRNGD